MPTANPPDLAVVVTTKNNMRTIGQSLSSVQKIAARIVVVDSGSTDGTIDLCRSMGAEILYREWDNFARQKQFALDCARYHRWVLLLDSDESLEPDLRESIQRVVAEDDPRYQGWMIRRKVWFLGAWLHHTFQPEWRLRLVRAGSGRMVGVDDPQLSYPHNVHEQLRVPGRIGRLRGICRHDAWADLGELFARQMHYAQLAAESATRGGSPINVLFNPPAAMLKQLVLKRGFLDGTRGLIVAAATFNFAALKHSFIAARRLAKTTNPND